MRDKIKDEIADRKYFRLSAKIIKASVSTLELTTDEWFNEYEDTLRRHYENLDYKYIRRYIGK